MTDGKPTVAQIAEVAAQIGRHYEIITCRGVEILIKRRELLTAIELSAEWTWDDKIEALANEMGIKLRRYR